MRQTFLQLNAWGGALLIIWNAAEAGFWLGPNASGAYEDSMFIRPLIFASRVFLCATVVRAVLLKKWTVGMLILGVGQAVVIARFRRLPLSVQDGVFFALLAFAALLLGLLWLDRRVLQNRAEEKWENQRPDGTPVKSPPSNPGQESGVPHP